MNTLNDTNRNNWFLSVHHQSCNPLDFHKMKWTSMFCFSLFGRNKAKDRLPRFQMHKFIINDNLLLVQLPVLFVRFWLFCLQRNNEEKLKMHRNQKCIKNSKRWIIWGWILKTHNCLFHRALSRMIYFIRILSSSINLFVTSVSSQQEYINILYSNKDFYLWTRRLKIFWGNRIKI